MRWIADRTYDPRESTATVTSAPDLAFYTNENVDELSLEQIADDFTDWYDGPTEYREFNVTAEDDAESFYVFAMAPCCHP